MENMVSILRGLTSQGSFFTRLMVSADDLRIEINTVGKLKLPLTHRKAKSLIKIARPAKFGWQDKTLLDQSVRDVWEISKSKVKIDKRAWHKTLHPLLEQIQANLGLAENGQFKASLHNLLVYAPGQFFRPHQDTEKLDGMVATLVVILPCEHSGGDLVIDHQGEKKRLQSSRSASDKLTCMAFYADCHHEVKPVTAGYRVALTYNLVLEGATEKVNVPSNSKAITSLTGALRSYFDQRLAENQSDETPTYRTLSPPKWVYLLDHDYTQKGLGWKHLKNSDLLRTKLLREAAKALNLDCYLALADIQEIWDCESDYDDRHYYSRYGRGRWDDDEEEEEVIEEDNYQLNELVDSNVSLRYWVDAGNTSVDYSELTISDNELCWTTDTEDFDPFQSEYEGWMGNYGNTLDRWYHRAAIILWRKEDHYPILCQVDPKKAAAEICQIAKKASTRREAQGIVKSILPYWCQYRGYGDKISWGSSVFTLARHLQSSSLAQSLITPLELTALTPGTAVAFVALADVYGSSCCLGILKSWSTSESNRHPDMINTFPQLIHKLAKAPKKSPDILAWLFNYQLTTLKKNHANDKQHHSLVELSRQSSSRINAVHDLLKGCIAAANHLFYRQVLDYVMANKTLYPLLNLVSLFGLLEKQVNDNDDHWGHEKFYQTLNDQLNREAHKASRKKDDWSIREKVACHCDDCKTLSQFLQSKALTNKIWPLAQARRAHIHRTIDGMGLPVTHETRRQGSPYKLILNKTEQLFLQESNQRKALQQALVKLTKGRKTTSLLE